MEIDREEIKKFEELAERWWDPESEFKPLHQINPLRLTWIDNTVNGLHGRSVLDLGCGGGILSESLARLGANVVGIDPCENNVAVAREHAERDSRLDGRLEYRVGTAEDFVASGDEGSFDVVCALEVIEHVSDLELFVESCCALTKSGGDVFFSTVNRTPLSYALGIVAAEYVLRMIPPGTHDWNRFVTPNELEAALLRGNASVESVCGMIMNPLSGRWFLDSNQHDVNYIVHASRH
mgnify:CR=1 FL=1